MARVAVPNVEDHLKAAGWKPEQLKRLRHWKRAYGLYSAHYSADGPLLSMAECKRLCLYQWLAEHGVLTEQL